jgi:uncharacterized phage protein (TIGR01671 family)
MNRIIKFRAWDGQKLTEPFSILHLLSNYNSEYANSREDISSFNFDGDGGTPILEQFTGLLDKNGKEIWEGDIVRFAYSDNTELISMGVISFLNQNGVYKCATFLIVTRDIVTRDGTPWDVPMSSDWVEVIGNIHENPALLK